MYKLIEFKTVYNVLISCEMEGKERDRVCDIVSDHSEVWEEK